MRRLLITEHTGYVTVENSDGVRVQAMNIEKALERFANHYALGWSDGETIKSGFEAAAVIETMMGQRRPGDQGHIHEGVVSG